MIIFPLQAEAENEETSEEVEEGSYDEKTNEDSALGDNNSLVMESEQDDIVTDDEEEQEKENEAEIPSEPGQVTSPRRLGLRSGAGTFKESNWVSIESF